jgi:triosephosphate isomerase (TIM)
MRPLVIVNFKTYPQATGERALRLAKICEHVAKELKVDIRVAVQPTDLALVAKNVSIPVYAQHVDIAEPGKSTGWITAQALKAAGAAGTLLNHAEHRISTQAIRNTTPHLRKVKLDIVIVAKDLHQLQEFESHADADYLCIEPPELIAGEVSVAVARPDIIRHAVHATKRPLLVGAGVKDHEDLSMALELGGKGVLLSSHIVLARDPERALRRLLTVRAL